MGLLKIGLFVFYCCISVCFTIVTSWNCFLEAILLLPMCSGLIIALHELSHFLFFVLFGFKVKKIRLGLISFELEKGKTKIILLNSGIFRGFCTIDESFSKNRTELIIAIVAGGISGLLVSLISLGILTLNIMAEKWDGFIISLFCVGLYSFYVTLLSPKSGDRKIIRRIRKRNMENDTSR